jgi:hypothetical protein
VTGTTPNVWSLARNLVQPLAANYVVGVERQLPWRLVAGASYSGSRSFDGLVGSDINTMAGGAVIAPCASPNQSENCETINRPNSNFGIINYVTNSNRATYNALIVSIRGNPSRQLNFQASYTLSHAQDFPEANTRFDQDGGLNVPSPSTYFNYFGDANWDVRNRFSLSGIYTLRGFSNGVAHVLTNGWSLSSVIVAQTGTPFWVVNTTSPLATTGAGDYNLDGTNYDIPNAPSFGCNVSYSRSSYLNGLFTASDFPAPSSVSEGDEPRNCYRNPGLFNVDASVAKNTHLPWLGEAGSLQLRFDFLNLFNHSNLGPVDGNMADGTFGKVTSALPARQIQLIARITF